jgi:hypothetical protein
VSENVTVHDGLEFHCEYFDEPDEDEYAVCPGEVTRVVITRVEPDHIWYLCTPHAVEFASMPELRKMFAWDVWIDEKDMERR